MPLNTGKLVILLIGLYLGDCYGWSRSVTCFNCCCEYVSDYARHIVSYEITIICIKKKTASLLKLSLLSGVKICWSCFFCTLDKSLLHERNVSILLYFDYLSGVFSSCILSFVFWIISEFLSLVIQNFFSLVIRWFSLLYVQTISYFSTFVYKFQQKSVKNISTESLLFRHSERKLTDK